MVAPSSVVAAARAIGFDGSPGRYALCTCPQLSNSAILSRLSAPGYCVDNLRASPALIYPAAAGIVHASSRHAWRVANYRQHLIDRAGISPDPSARILAPASRGEL